MERIAIMIDDVSDINIIGGGAYIEKHLAKGLTAKYPDEVKVIYKKYDWNYITSTLDELRQEKIRLIFDLSYWPVNYYQVKLFTNNLKLSEIDFLLGESLYYARRLKVKTALLLQGMGLHKIKFAIPYNLLNYLKVKKNLPIDIFLNTRNKIIYTIYKGIRESLISNFIKHSKIVARIYGLSRGQLESLGLGNSKKATVIDPPVAVEKEILNMRKDVSKKKDFCVFYARLIPLKGILEIPFITREIIDITGYKELRVLIIGKFPDTHLKDLFFSLVERLNLENNILYKGYIPRENFEEFFNIISDARCVIYPSHEDSFSVAVLEAIAAGTPVIAYDIPGLKSVYQGLDIVKFVREFDIKSMAIEATKILRLREDEYNNLIYNEKTKKFLDKYTNWDLVVDKYYKDLFAFAKNYNSISKT